MKESDETPKMEARAHSAGFLRKAASMKMKKMGGGKKSNPFGKRPGASVASPMKSMGKKGAY